MVRSLLLTLSGSLALSAFTCAQLGMRALAGDMGYSGGAVGQNLYLQNFDTLPNGDWVNNNVAFPGLYLARSGNVRITQSDGSANSGGFHSFGTSTAATDRAFGYTTSASSGPGGIALRIKDVGTLPNTGFWIDFVMEQWRADSLTPSQLAFSYVVSASALTNPFVSGLGVPSLSIASPINTTVGAINGNALVNQRSVSVFLPLATPVPAGGEVAIRWVHAQPVAGARHGLGIDNHRLKAVPEPAGMVALGLGLATLRRRRFKK